MNDRLVVWMSAASHDGIRGTDWHLVTALAHHTPILWVDPPVSPLTQLRKGKRGMPPWRPRLIIGDGGMPRVMPVALPGLTRAGVRRSTAPLLRAQVRWALRRLGVRPKAVVTTHLEDVLGRWGNDTVDVLYGTDDYVAGAELMRLSARHLQAQERAALERADVVFAISPLLAERWSQLGANPIVLPNGCDPATFRSVNAVGGLPGVALPQPVIGTMGHLSDRIDIGLLEAVSDAGFSLLLIGPRDSRWEPERFAALTARSTVHYTGLVRPEELPSYLSVIDVGLTPYINSGFNRASFPLKTLEFLAAGRPVVATNLPATQWLLDRGGVGVLFPVESASHVISAVRDAVRAGNRPNASAHCRAFAERHSWQRRAEEFARVLGLTVPQASSPIRSPSPVRTP